MPTLFNSLSTHSPHPAPQFSCAVSSIFQLPAATQQLAKECDLVIAIFSIESNFSNSMISALATIAASTGVPCLQVRHKVSQSYASVRYPYPRPHLSRPWPRPRAPPPVQGVYASGADPAGISSLWVQDVAALTSRGVVSCARAIYSPIARDCQPTTSPILSPGKHGPGHPSRSRCGLGDTKWCVGLVGGPGGGGSTGSDRYTADPAPHVAKEARRERYRRPGPQVQDHRRRRVGASQQI
jgi:hypothetical protein